MTFRQIGENHLSKRLMLRYIVDLAAMFFARTSGVLVSLLFLPLYARLMSPGDFGLASLALTLQAAVQVADLGVSLVLSREVARYSNRSHGRPLRISVLLKSTELVLASAHTIIGALILAFLVMAAGAGTTSAAQGFPVALLFVGFSLVLVLHNSCNTALVATQNYWHASAILVVGVITRAIVTLFALAQFGATIEVFLSAQVVSLTFHYLWTRSHLMCKIETPKMKRSSRVSWTHIAYIWRESLPFLAMSVSGVIATQIDKPLLATFAGASALSVYFLAYTYAQALVSVVSAPISQFFHPKVMASARAGQPAALTKAMSRFSALLVCASFGPGILLMVFAPELTALWLGGLEEAASVAALTRILLVGTIVMSLAFLPYVLLTALDDASFMGRAGMILCIIAVAAYALAAAVFGSVGVASAVVGYQTAMTGVLWIRILRSDKTRDAAQSALKVIICMVLAVSPWCALWVWSKNLDLPTFILFGMAAAGTIAYAASCAVLARRLRLV